MQKKYRMKGLSVCIYQKKVLPLQRKGFLEKKIVKNYVSIY